MYLTSTLLGTYIHYIYLHCKSTAVCTSLEADDDDKKLQIKHHIPMVFLARKTRIEESVCIYI